MPEVLLGIIVVAAVLLIAVFFRYVPLGLWIRARASGVPLTIGMLIGMRLRRISPHRLVDALITASKAGLNVNINQLEKHFLAGGNIERRCNLNRLVPSTLPAAMCCRRYR